MSSFGKARTGIEGFLPGAAFVGAMVFRDAATLRSAPVVKSLPQTVARVAIIYFPRGEGLRHFHRAQFRRPRRRILSGLFLSWPHDVTCHDLPSPVFRQRLKTLLDLAVLEPHEGQHHN